MNQNHPRRVLTAGMLGKRKERESPYSPAVASRAGATFFKTAAEPVSSNRLLAGYLAHEFLTEGTLFGQKWDPARAEAVPLSAAAPAVPRKTKSVDRAAAEPTKQHGSYADVASLMKTDGVHVPGIVNPTQLARWIQM